MEIRLGIRHAATNVLRMVAILTVVAAIFLSSAAPGSDRVIGTNLLSNPSFDLPSTGSNESLIPGWTVQFRQPNEPPLSRDMVDLVTDRAQAHSGKQCVRMVNRGRELGYILQSTPLTLVPGRKYEVSFWARGKAGSQMFAAMGATGLQERFFATPQWERCSREFICGEGARGNSAPLSIYAIKAGYQGNIDDPEVFIDDVCLGEITCGLAEEFGDHMVLQREKPVAVWGWANAPGQKVRVSFRGQTKDAVADKDGHWKVMLDPMKAGGPFEMSISGSPVVTYDVMVGDVWLCTGQSNMEFGIDKVNGIYKSAPEVVAQANYPNIRLWSAPNQTATTPQWAPKRKYDWQAKWMRCTPRNVLCGDWGGFPAIGYFFAREIQQDIGVPIGLMKIACGATSAEAWTSAEALRTIPNLEPACPRMEDIIKKTPEGQPVDLAQNVTSASFNGTLAPVIPYGIKGILWYQGEHNGGDASYDVKLKTLISDWRKRFGQGDVPFLIAQICNWAGSERTGGGWQKTRDGQLRASQTVPNAGLVVTLDLQDPENGWEIHPRNKQEVAHRFALLAKAKVYGEKIEYSGPTYRKIACGDGKVRLHFDHIGGGLVAKDGSLFGDVRPGDTRLLQFTIAGEDRNFVEAHAYIDGDTVVVSSEKVNKPVAVRYEWQCNVWPLGNLFNKQGLPASAFRTDNWPIK